MNAMVSSRLFATHQSAEKTRRLRLRRILNAVDFDLGLAGAPLVFGDAREDGGDVGAAATPRLLGCWKSLVNRNELESVRVPGLRGHIESSNKRWRG